MTKESNVHIRSGNKIIYPDTKVVTFRSENAAKKESRKIQLRGKGLGRGDVVLR